MGGPLNCGRLNCAMLHPQTPHQWCRACLIEAMERMFRAFNPSLTQHVATVVVEEGRKYW